MSGAKVADAAENCHSIVQHQKPLCQTTLSGSVQAPPQAPTRGAGGIHLPPLYKFSPITYPGTFFINSFSFLENSSCARTYLHYRGMLQLLLHVCKLCLNKEGRARKESLQMQTC